VIPLCLEHSEANLQGTVLTKHFLRHDIHVCSQSVASKVAVALERRRSLIKEVDNRNQVLE
jgi:hypothetical protein